MFRKCVLKDIGGFDEKIKFWQEYELTIRLCQKTMVYFIDEPLVLYRKDLTDKNRKTNRFHEWKENVYYINKKHQKLFERLNEEEKEQVRLKEYYDAVERLKLQKDNKRSREYLKKIMKINPTFKNVIKFIFNLSGDDILNIKIKLKLM